ncbi:hypothetical protein [Thermococcus sp. JdF3]|uniref:hypothetical protein n=1 Tax=Thermococcus sp. JdF3 TaxID=1638258 RepID=UPI00143CA582|nr:hypothetical protein [Thermococcus sp. JdF3]NJE00907.1 hypothetical protein [Thermococcus sp. JdF3]
MAMGSLVSLLIVLTPILGIVAFVTVMIKRYLDEYVPLRVTVRHKQGRTELIIQTKRKTERIDVASFVPKAHREVLNQRIDGLGFRGYRLGYYTGGYGEVVSYAISDSGILIKDMGGKRFYLAINNIQEVMDALLDGTVTERVIEVRK